MTTTSTSGTAHEPDALDDVETPVVPLRDDLKRLAQDGWGWLFVAFLAIAIIATVIVLTWHPWTNDDSADSSAIKITAEVAVIPWKGEGLTPGVGLRDGTFVAANEGTTTTVSFGSQVTLNDDGGTLAASKTDKAFTVTVAFTGDKTTEVEAIALNGLFPSTTGEVAEVDDATNVLVLTGILADWPEGLKSVTVFTTTGK